MTAPWLVLKFGGSSVSTAARWERIRNLLTQRIEDGLRPLVVCSALSGVSNLLEQLLGESARGQEPDDLLASIRELHSDLGASLGLDAAALLGQEWAELERLARGIALTREASPRLQARVLALGELMSTRLGAAWLSEQGVSVQWLDAREALESQQTPELAERLGYLSAVCRAEPDPELQQRLAQEPAQVLLTQGFIARNDRGETVLLGRGGSDTSAAYFSAVLEAVRCEIWSDVPGMYSADPRRVPEARLLHHLDYFEAQEIASMGAKCLHPRSIAPLRRARIPLSLHWLDRPEVQGTQIDDQAATSASQVKAIGSKTNVLLFSLDGGGMWHEVGFLADVFTCFKRHGLSVDLVSTSEMNVTVTLDAGPNILAQEVLDRLRQDLSEFCRVRVIGPCAVVSLVGRNIRGILHQLGPALELFEEQRIYLVSQAASDLNLSFAVDEDQAERLVRQLHGLLFQNRGADPLLGPTWKQLQAIEIQEQTPAQRWWRTKRPELLELAQEETPLYIYDGETLDASVGSLRNLSSVDRVLYAMKANPFQGILQRFHRLGVAFECVSPGELDRVFSLFPDLNPAEVLFTPNFAPRAEYEMALERGVQLTLDNLHPLEEWPELFRHRELFVRLDPGRGRGHHEHVRTAGAGSKFGIAREEMSRLQELVQRSGCRITGLHAHSGSGIHDPESWTEVGLYLAEAAERFPDVRVLDLGGGLGVPEKPGQDALDLARLDESLARFRKAHPRFEIWIEPGRYLVATAGILLARVTQLKSKGSIQYVGVDAGMHTLLRPALYGAYHDIVNLSRVDGERTLQANVVGPICESGDVLGFGRRLPTSQEGDVFLIDTAGAYGRAMSSEYNLRSPAKEVLI